jgi:hypothetical protein
MFRHRDALWRPGQDCSVIYGGKLALCRVDKLSPDGFCQTAVSELAPAPGTAISGVHTLNCAQGFEVIDIFGAKSRDPAKLILSASQAAQPPEQS